MDDKKLMTNEHIHKGDRMKMYDHYESLKRIHEKTQILIAQRDELLEALEEIAKCEGPFSRDQLAHAGNVIENMASIAERAIEKVKGE